jgi:hypothetical protein
MFRKFSIVAVPMLCDRSFNLYERCVQDESRNDAVVTTTQVGIAAGL